VHNMAIDGNFDDCQAIVKTLFKQQTDDPELKAIKLGAVNSINWARILAQIVYYFSGYHQWLKLKPDRKYGDKVSFVVPTGNFGNALAGHYARAMGLPIEKLVVATNDNDILHRFITNGEYSKGKCFFTLAPAMDITIPSNFERYLFELAGRDGAKLAGWMASIGETGTFDVTQVDMDALRSEFASGSATDDQIRAAQKDHEQRFDGYLHCPHTAVGIHTAENVVPNDGPYIVMATAHHGKFGKSLESAAEVKRPALPKQLVALAGGMRRMVQAPNDAQMVKKYLIDCVAPTPEAVEAGRETAGACGTGQGGCTIA